MCEKSSHKFRRETYTQLIRYRLDCKNQKQTLTHLVTDHMMNEMAEIARMRVMLALLPVMVATEDYIRSLDAMLRALNPPRGYRHRSRT